MFKEGLTGTESHVFEPLKLKAVAGFCAEELFNDKTNTR